MMAMSPRVRVIVLVALLIGVAVLVFGGFKLWGALAAYIAPENATDRKDLVQTFGLIVAGVVMVPVMVAVPGAAASPKAVRASSLHEFKGRIVSINRDRHTFRMRRGGTGTYAENRPAVKIKATRKTRYERPLHNFRDLHKGLRIHVKAKRSNGRWVAVKIERV